MDEFEKVPTSGLMQETQQARIRKAVKKQTMYALGEVTSTISLPFASTTIPSSEDQRLQLDLENLSLANNSAKNQSKSTHCFSSRCTEGLNPNRSLTFRKIINLKQKNGEWSRSHEFWEFNLHLLQFLTSRFTSGVSPLGDPHNHGRTLPAKRRHRRRQLLSAGPLP